MFQNMFRRNTSKENKLKRFLSQKYTFWVIIVVFFFVSVRQFADIRSTYIYMTDTLNDYQNWLFQRNIWNLHSRMCLHDVVQLNINNQIGSSQPVVMWKHQSVYDCQVHQWIARARFWHITFAMRLPYLGKTHNLAITQISSFAMNTTVKLFRFCARLYSLEWNTLPEIEALWKKYAKDTGLPRLNSLNTNAVGPVTFSYFGTPIIWHPAHTNSQFFL